MFLSNFKRNKIKSAIKGIKKEEKKLENPIENKVVYIYNDLKNSKLLTVIDVFEKFGYKLEILEIPIDKTIFNYILNENLNTNNIEERKILPSIEFSIEPEEELKIWENLKIIQHNTKYLEEIFSHNEEEKFILLFSYLPFYEFKEFLKFYNKNVYKKFISNLKIIIDETLYNDEKKLAK